MIPRSQIAAFTKEAASLYHGSPTANLKELEPRFDPRTGETAIFLKGDRESAAAYAVLPSRHDSNVNYSTHQGKFTGGKVHFSKQPVDSGYIYEFHIPDGKADKIKNSYLLRENATPHSVHKITRQEAEQMGWKFEKKAAVIAHISGPPGSGKTTLLQELAKKHPGLVTKDLDEFSDEAKKVLNLNKSTKDLTDAEATLKKETMQRLTEEYLKKHENSQVVLGGLYNEKFWPHTKWHGKPVAEEHFALNTGPLISAWRRYRRSKKFPGHEQSLGAIYRNYGENRKDEQALHDLGYASRSPDDIATYIDRRIQMKKTAANKLRLRPRVTVFIHNDKNELLAEHHSDLGGYYKLPGGGVEAGQSVQSAARREALEEVGYDVGRLRVVHPPTTLVWPADMKKQFKSESLKAQYDGSKEYWFAAPVGKQNKSLYGSEGDALANAKFHPLDEVLAHTQKTDGKPAEALLIDRDKSRALEGLRKLLQRG